MQHKSKNVSETEPTLESYGPQHRGWDRLISAVNGVPTREENDEREKDEEPERWDGQG